MKPIDSAERLHKKDWEVRTVPLLVAQELVRKYHYSKGGANTATYRHGLFKKGSDECVGVAWWIPPTKGAALATWHGPFTEVLALSRLAIAPEVPKNAAVFLMMNSVKLIKKAKRFKCLVTYADDWQGHVGTIYKAGGWEYRGKTAPEATWVKPDGQMVARKAGPKTRTKAEMLALGYIMKGRFSKHKYRYVLEN